MFLRFKQLVDSAIIKAATSANEHFSYDIRFEFIGNIRLRSSNTFNNRISATSDQNMENTISQRRFLCFAAHVQHRLFLLGDLWVSDRRQTGDDRKFIHIGIKPSNLGNENQLRKRKQNSVARGSIVTF